MHNGNESELQLNNTALGAVGNSEVSAEMAVRESFKREREALEKRVEERLVELSYRNSYTKRLKKELSAAEIKKREEKENRLRSENEKRLQLKNEEIAREKDELAARARANATGRQ